jgi:hypothetical protein
LRVFLRGKDLGKFPQLRVLGMLSLLQHEFYRACLVPSLSTKTVSLTA